MKTHYTSLIASAVVLIAFATNALAAINVVNYWRMGEHDAGAISGGAASGTIDSFGPHNLTISGQAFYSNDVDSAAFLRNGTTLSVNFGAAGGYGLASLVSTAQDNFGVEAWVKPASVTGGQTVVYNGHTGTSGWGVIINNFTYSVLFGGKVVFGAATATANVWTHVAVVRDGGVATLYVDGIVAATSGVVPNLPTGNFGVAAPPQGGAGQSLIGLVDEVRVFTFAAGQFSPDDLLVNAPLGIPPYALGATALLVDGNAGSSSVVLAVDPWTRAWTNTANAPWLHFSLDNESGVGTANVIFTYDANPGPTRSGTLTIAGRVLTVTQAGSMYVAARPVTTLVSSGLNQPAGVAVDGAGNVYIADHSNHMIKKWTVTNNAVSTLVSSGLNGPTDVAVDGAGNLYIADFFNHAIKKWTAASNTVTTLVPGANFPRGVAVDGLGNVYFSEIENHAVKKWTLAENAVTPLVTSGLFNPRDVAVDAAGNVYIVDWGNRAIKKWSVDGAVSTVASGVLSPLGVAVDGSGNLYITESANDRIMKWTAANNTLTTLVSSDLSLPVGIAMDGAGNLYFADANQNVIKEMPWAFVDPTPRSRSQLAGNDSLPVVLPTTANLRAPFAPTSDQPWLTISGIANGVISCSFTANNGPSRTANITVLGQAIPITQAGLVTPPFLTDWKILGNGAFQFAFSNGVGTSFTVLSATNLSLPFSNWTVAGTPTSIAPGLFQFTTQPIANDPQRFYGIRSP